MTELSKRTSHDTLNMQAQLFQQLPPKKLPGCLGRPPDDPSSEDDIKSLSKSSGMEHGFPHLSVWAVEDMERRDIGETMRLGLVRIGICVCVYHSLTQL
jgi:hypothetical protein